MIDTFILEALVNWLFAGAPPKADFAATTAELARRIVGAGLSVDTIALHLKNINPMVLGTMLSWTPRRGVQVARYSHAQMETDLWIGSVPYLVVETGRAIRARFGTGSGYDTHASMQLMLTRGDTDYVGCPLFGRFTLTGAIGVGTKRAGGFTEDEIATIRRLQDPLARVTEAEILHENTVSLLSTYVGRGRAKR